jgi:hypothetical protein
MKTARLNVRIFLKWLMTERLMQKNGIIYAGKWTVKGWLFVEKRRKKWTENSVGRLCI